MALFCVITIIPAFMFNRGVIKDLNPRMIDTLFLIKFLNEAI